MPLKEARTEVTAFLCNVQTTLKPESKAELAVSFLCSQGITVLPPSTLNRSSETDKELSAVFLENTVKVIYTFSDFFLRFDTTMDKFKSIFHYFGNIFKYHSMFLKASEDFKNLSYTKKNLICIGNIYKNPFFFI